MKQVSALAVSLLILCAGTLSGCDKLGLGQQTAGSGGAPSEQELQQISYMSRAGAGRDGRKLYDHLEQAKTCGDFELAMRWNRPPAVEAGPFHRKMIYLKSTLPADLPRESEVQITGTIVNGETLPSGSFRWMLRMGDGTRVEAIETTDFWVKQEQAAQEAGPAAGNEVDQKSDSEAAGQSGAKGGRKTGRRGRGKATESNTPPVAIIRPEKPGRVLCAQGVYQGMDGKDPDGGGKLPLISVLYAMDRDR